MKAEKQKSENNQKVEFSSSPQRASENAPIKEKQRAEDMHMSSHESSKQSDVSEKHRKGENIASFSQKQGAAAHEHAVGVREASHVRGNHPPRPEHHAADDTKADVSAGQSSGAFLEGDAPSLGESQGADTDQSETGTVRGLDLEQENKRLKDQVIRLHADMENAKKRLAKLSEERVRDKVSALLLDIIVHIDNFERAFEAQLQMQGSQKNKGGTEIAAVFEGFDLIKTQFLKNLEGHWGLQVIDSLNKEFDPQQHEALLREESENANTATVVQVFMKGYKYLDRVLRPAKVKVALPKQNTKNEIQNKENNK